MDFDFTGSQRIKIYSGFLLALLALFLPLSFKIFFPAIGTVIIFPAEIMIGMLVLMFGYDLVFKKGFAQSHWTFIKHPLTIIILIYLCFNAASGAFSTMHLVSLKAVIVKSSYIIVFYFFMFTVLKTNLDNYAELLKLYAFSIALVILYSLLIMSKVGFNRYGSGYACHPFYNDHTIFAAAILFLIPIFIGFNFFPKTFEFIIGKRILVFLGIIILFAGFYFSFCRAAWVSMFSGILLFLLIIVGFRFRGLMVLLFLTLSAIYFFYTPLLNTIKENKVDSTVTNAGLFEHFHSITNITSDVSNKERLNRWDCSIKMFKQRPVLGYGPGTYQFQYIPFQDSANLTYISRQVALRPGFGSFYWHSNAVGLLQDKDYTHFQGKGGTAHSEYFLELAESGLPSTLALIGLFFAGLFFTLRTLSKTSDKKIKIIVVTAICALTTYFVHGVFNNFLDDCKIAFLFWSSLCVIAVADIKTCKQTKY